MSACPYTYAIVSMKLFHAQVSDLNACWNFVYRRIFGFSKWSSVRVFINGICRLDFYHIREYLCLKIFGRGMVCENTIFPSKMKSFFVRLVFDSYAIKWDCVYQVEISLALYHLAY